MICSVHKKSQRRQVIRKVYFTHCKFHRTLDAERDDERPYIVNHTCNKNSTENPLSSVTTSKGTKTKRLLKDLRDKCVYTFTLYWLDIALPPSVLDMMSHTWCLILKRHISVIGVSSTRIKGHPINVCLRTDNGFITHCVCLWWTKTERNKGNYKVLNRSFLPSYEDIKCLQCKVSEISFLIKFIDS